MLYTKPYYTNYTNYTHLFPPKKLDPSFIPILKLQNSLKTQDRSKCSKIFPRENVGRNLNNNKFTIC